MKRLILGIFIGMALTATIFISIVAVAQSEILTYIRPLVIDIQQSVPITTDVRVPLDNGTAVTATIPLTVNVALQVSLSGVITDSIQIIEDAKQAVSIIEPTPVPKSSKSSQQKGSLTYTQVCIDAPKELTDIKLKKYHETLIGTEVLWTGYIYDVVKNQDNTYTVQVSSKSREDSIIFARNVEIIGVPEDVAAELDVNQIISYSGKITAIEEFISDCNPVKVQYESLTY